MNKWMIILSRGLYLYKENKYLKPTTVTMKNDIVE